MSRITRKEQIEVLKERLKDNPRALAELELWEYQRSTEWYHGKLSKEANKAAAMKKHFLRG